MKRLFLGLAAATIWLHSWSAAAQAQVVQVAPGYVRAPFVRVYTDPRGGGAYVRAPFVEVFAPGFGLRRFVDELPTPDQLAQMEWRTLRQIIRESSAQLDSQLTSLSTGDLWRAHLKIADIRALAPESEGPPPANAAEQLQVIQRIFSTTRDNPTYRNISSLEGFRWLHAALGEFVVPPTERLRRQLLAAAEELDRSLDALSAERGWHKHLALPEGLADSPDDDPKASPPDFDLLTKSLKRYDSVSRSDEYRVIARLPAFRATHSRLAAYVEARKDMSRQPPAEELPLPKPE